MKHFNLFILFILMSCSASKVVVDYDGDIDFLKYKRFEFYEDNGDGLNEFDIKRITAAIEKNLEIQGLFRTSNPDFFIYFDSEKTEQQNNNIIGIGIGNSGRNGGIGVSGGIPIGGKKIIEKIVIKFIDASTNELIWEGFLSSTVKEKRSPEERLEYINLTVQKILKMYPPKKSFKN